MTADNDTRHMTSFYNETFQHFTKMLNKLRTYAEKKGLSVNTAKAEVFHFNSKSVSPLQNPFTYDGVVLPEKDRFKYVGMLLDRRMNPKIAEEHAVRPYMAAQSRISEVAKSHDFKSLMLCSHVPNTFFT